MKGINFIGDIHGRSNWKELVKDDYINVFVGDYFDPYDFYTIDQLIDNFNEIIQYKKDHPETILLIGNHDAHYLPDYCSDGESTRYNLSQAHRIQKLLLDNMDLFYGIAYYHEPTKTFTTHAGVSSEWFDKYFHTYESDPKKVEEMINNLWKEKSVSFTFGMNCKSFSDYYGESFTHSPIWIRPQSLIYCNYFKNSDVTQVIGHSQRIRIGKSDDNKIVLIDVLGTKTESYVVEQKEG